jgi:hypothetical protein
MKNQSRGHGCLATIESPALSDVCLYQDQRMEIKMEKLNRASLPDLELEVAPAGAGQETKVLAIIWWVGCILL